MIAVLSVPHRFFAATHVCIVIKHQGCRLAQPMLSISALLQWCALALPLVQGLTVGVQPPSPTAARLTVVQVTDVYTLENFPRLKTLLHDVRQTNPTTISMLTGDFLAPYLLSSIDKGHGMSRRPLAVELVPRRVDAVEARARGYGRHARRHDAHDQRDAYRLSDVGQPRSRY